jgi:hypothetical protein
MNEPFLYPHQWLTLIIIFIALLTTVVMCITIYYNRSFETIGEILDEIQLQHSNDRQDIIDYYNDTTVDLEELTDSVKAYRKEIEKIEKLIKGREK